MRPMWTGSISFGLVNIPVNLYSGSNPRQGLDLDMLHKADHAPIRYARICRKDGQEVPWEDIVKGYEHQEGDYIVLTKGLGVPEAGIKTNTSTSYGMPLIPDPQTKEDGYTLQLTVTVASQELAQKVQNYLVTTTPTGSVSPQPTFSQAKQKELEAAARDQATKDAKQKADQTATNLGFKLGSVKTIRDGAGFGAIEPYPVRLEADQSTGSGPLGLHPGENELSYSVTVTYFIR